MTSKKILIQKQYKKGQYSTQELAKEHDVTIRYVQMCLKEDEENVDLGRTAQIKIFSPLDIIRISKNPEELNKIMEIRFKEYYIRRTKRELKYREDHWQHHIRRMKLRALVMKRDEYKCSKCGSSVALEIHHIIPVKKAPEKEFDLDNCIILCHKCHPR